MGPGSTGLRRLAATLVCIAAFGLAACGSSDNDSDSQPAASPPEGSAVAKQLIAVGNALQAAYASGDGPGLCRILNPADVKDQFGSRKGCAKRASAAFNSGANTPKFDFESIKVNGNKASVKVKNEDGTISDFDFIRVGGKWFVDVNPSADSSSAGEASDSE